MAIQRRILVVEDDSAVREGMIDALEFDGYETLAAADGTAGLRSAVEAECDLILLDLMLPGLGGLEILEEVRRQRPTLPVIILTARGEESDRVKGLKLGADDYVVKPFGKSELLARIEAVLRRSPERPSTLQEVAIPGGKIHFDRHEVQFASGTRMSLSEREVELLQYLAQNSGRVVSRDEILSRIWRLDPRGIADTRTIDMHIARLREKLSDGPGKAAMIRTVRGKGYVFDGSGSS